MNYNLIAARANLWKAQERFKYWPDLTVVVGDLAFNMNSQAWTIREFGYSPEIANPQEPYIRCTMPESILDDILHRRVHWNNAEIGCLINFDRRPNVYDPDFHMIMSFFHI